MTKNQKWKMGWMKQKTTFYKKCWLYVHGFHPRKCFFGKKMFPYKSTNWNFICFNGFLVNTSKLITLFQPALWKSCTNSCWCSFGYSRTSRIETVQDFLIKLDIKPLINLLKISIFSLNNVIVRLTKIMNRADKN